jgi:hypothetical protein
MYASPTPLPLRQAPNRLLVVLVVVLAVLVVILAVNSFQGSSTTGVQGSGHAASETRHVAPFDELDLAGSNNVVVRSGDKQSVVVRGDDNLLSMVTTRVQDGRLAIGTPGSFSTKAPMRVEITVPSLQALTLSGSGIITAADLQARHLTVRLAGSGVVRATGAVTRLDVVLTGSGDVELGQLVARHARAAIEASGRIVVQATDSLDATVRGSGVILYSGGPERVTRNVSGSGAIVGG